MLYLKDFGAFLIDLWKHGVGFFGGKPQFVIQLCLYEVGSDDSLQAEERFKGGEGTLEDQIFLEEDIPNVIFQEEVTKLDMEFHWVKDYVAQGL